MNAIDNANKAVADAQQKAAVLQAYAPHIAGNPHLFYPDGKRACVAYKCATIAELQALLIAHPPVPSVKFRGTFAGIKPADEYRERDGNAEECDGMTLNVEAGHCVGAYPCDQHAMNARWYSDTPAGRLRVTVDFAHNTRADWPTIAIHYAAPRRRGQREDDRTIESISLQAQPPHSERIQFGSGDRKTPGSFTLWFRDAETRALSLECIA